MTLTLEPDVRDGLQQARPRSLLIDTDRHRRLIGWIGVLLPFILPVSAMLRPTKDLSPLLHSLSAYYYTSSIAVLEGTLVALALFLVAYRGYPNKYQWVDEWAARVAGTAALVIALFPTYPPENVPNPPWWTEMFGKIHDWASVVMFVMFALFSLWLFRKTDQSKQDLSRGKRRRNQLYFFCGITIVGSMLFAAYRLKTGSTQIFVPETLAIVAFSVSWLVKGGAARRLMPD